MILDLEFMNLNNKKHNPEILNHKSEISNLKLLGFLMRRVLFAGTAEFI